MSEPGIGNDNVVSDLVQSQKKGILNKAFEKYGFGGHNAKEWLWTANALGWFGYDGLRVGARDRGVGLDYATNIGGSDFWKAHIGDAYETSVFMLASRATIEAIDIIREKMGKEKYDPRLKMWLSVLIGMAIPIAVETTGMSVSGLNFPDSADVLGPVVAGVLGGSLWELSNFLSDENKVNSAGDRIANAKESLKMSAVGVQDWIKEIPSHAQNFILSQLEGYDATIDYMTQEGRIAFLMLADMVQKKIRK